MVWEGGVRGEETAPGMDPTRPLMTRLFSSEIDSVQDLVQEFSHRATVTVSSPTLRPSSDRNRDYGSSPNLDSNVRRPL